MRQKKLRFAVREFLTGFAVAYGRQVFFSESEHQSRERTKQEYEQAELVEI